MTKIHSKVAIDYSKPIIRKENGELVPTKIGCEVDDLETAQAFQKEWGNKPHCGRCGSRDEIDILSDGTILCKRKGCLHVTINHKVRKKRLKRNGKAARNNN